MYYYYQQNSGIGIYCYYIEFELSWLLCVVGWSRGPWIVSQSSRAGCGMVRDFRSGAGGGVVAFCQLVAFNYLNTKFS